MKIAQALTLLRPSATWEMVGDQSDLANLVWLDAVQLRPTDAEILIKTAEEIPSLTPIEKLTEFLAANPDVMTLL